MGPAPRCPRVDRRCPHGARQGVGRAVLRVPDPDLRSSGTRRAATPPAPVALEVLSDAPVGIGRVRRAQRVVRDIDLQVYAPERRFVPQPGWTVVDVGANIGAFSVWAAGMMGASGRLLAIEPNPVSFRELRRSLDELAVDATAFAVACGDVEGEVTLHFQPGYTVSSSLTSFDAATESATVPMRRLDALLGETGISHVDLLKIDVEGAEELVLRGAGEALSRISRVVLETTHDDIGRGVRAVMDASGFTLIHDESRHWSIAGLELLAYERSAGPDPGLGRGTDGDTADPDRQNDEPDRPKQHEEPDRHG